MSSSQMSASSPPGKTPRLAATYVAQRLPPVYSSGGFVAFADRPPKTLLPMSLTQSQAQRDLQRQYYDKQFVARARNSLSATLPFVVSSIVPSSCKYAPFVSPTRRELPPGATY
jgi:hypothetical protein